MNSFLAQFPYVEAILAVCMLVGGFFGIKNGRRSSLTKFQEDTIKAQNDRIKILEDKIVDMGKEHAKQIDELKRENTKQQHVIDTITSALRKQGTVITVDGELVPVSDKPGIHRKRTTAHPPLAREKDESA